MRVQACRRVPVGPLFIRRPMAPAVASEHATWRDLRCLARGDNGVDGGRSRLRHLGARREQLLGEHVGCVQQIHDLLECVWPAALESAKQPFKSTTWVAAMSVIIGRDGGDFARTRRLGPARLERLVRVEVERRGKIRPCLRILQRLYAALSDLARVLAHRLGAFERIGWLIED